MDISTRVLHGHVLQVDEGVRGLIDRHTPDACLLTGRIEVLQKLFRGNEAYAFYPALMSGGVALRRERYNLEAVTPVHYSSEALLVVAAGFPHFFVGSQGDGQGESLLNFVPQHPSVVQLTYGDVICPLSQEEGANRFDRHMVELGSYRLWTGVACSKVAVEGGLAVATYVPKKDKL